MFETATHVFYKSSRVQTICVLQPLWCFHTMLFPVNNNSFLFTPFCQPYDAAVQSGYRTRQVFRKARRVKFLKNKRGLFETDVFQEELFEHDLYVVRQKQRGFVLGSFNNLCLKNHVVPTVVVTYLSCVLALCSFQQATALFCPLRSVSHMMLQYSQASAQDMCCEHQARFSDKIRLLKR